MTAPSQIRIVVPLGITQTLAWASSYYLPAILADPVAHDLGLTANWMFGAFSAALVISGLLGPRIGRQIDLVGGRWVLSASNIVLAGGLVALSFTHSVAMLLFAWLLLGIGMGLGLYDAAFGALGRIFGQSARSAITGVTLFAGFASTIGWPLTSLGLGTIGWRETCLAWAVTHIVVGLPLNLIFIPKASQHEFLAANDSKPSIPIDRTMILLALVFAAAWTVTGAMAAHFPRILEAAGASPSQAILAGALIGPAQVAARIAEAGLLSRYHPLISTRLACLAHPIGAALVGIFGGPAAMALAILHGAGNGILTIARGTLPLAIFGPENYAYRLGILGAPSRVAQALAPFAFSLLLEKIGLGVLVVSSVLSLVALGALCLITPTNPIGRP